MRKQIGLIFLVIAWGWVMPGVAPRPAESADVRDPATGVLEVDCNFTGIRLYLCPKDNYVEKETAVFFGLIKSIKHVCSSEEISLGETPLKPMAVPAGRYILMIPPDYAWEKEGPVELTLLPGEKTYFLLKLFSSRANSPESGHGGGGGAAGGGRGD